MEVSTLTVVPSDGSTCTHRLPPPTPGGCRGPGPGTRRGLDTPVHCRGPQDRRRTQQPIGGLSTFFLPEDGHERLVPRVKQVLYPVNEPTYNVTP